jgi:hypothetical protein
MAKPIFGEHKELGVRFLYLSTLMNFLKSIAFKTRPLERHEEIE